MWNREVGFDVECGSRVSMWNRSRSVIICLLKYVYGCLYYLGWIRRTSSIMTITSGSTIAFAVVTNVANLVSPNLWKQSNAFFQFLSAFSVINIKLNALLLFKLRKLTVGLTKEEMAGVVGYNI